MASFPDSVKSFTAKASGQNIDPAHMNDVQDEVNAIEAGYRNGTAPINSSGSTVTSLSVTGGSTVATLQAAASTFSVRPVMPPPPNFALVFLGSTVTIGSSAASTLAWTQQSVVLNSSMHSTGTNPERLIPQTTGLYQVTAQVAMTGAGAGDRGLFIEDSSGTGIALQSVIAGATAQAWWINATGYKRFDALGGYATARISLSGNSTLSLSSGVGHSWFSMVKL